MKIAAGIVLYNPEYMTRFTECLDGILAQAEKVYLFDNSPEAVTVQLPARVVYMTKHKNMGIAYALNRIMESAKRDGYLWVITMDQDSIIPQGLISEYIDVINKNKNIGIVCPQVIDSRRIYMETKKEPKYEYIDFCITSASCTSVEAWEKAGRFDEWLFVDLVDNDFCKRLRVSGYKIIRLNNLILNQEFGKIIPKNERSQRFWIGVSRFLHNQNFAKFSYRKFVSPMRVYYTCRNVIYVNKKLANYGPIAYRDNYNCRSYAGFVISFIIPSILRAKEKRAVIKAAINGTRDGKRKKVHRWKANKG